MLAIRRGEWRGDRKDKAGTFLKTRGLGKNKRSTPGAETAHRYIFKARAKASNAGR